MDDHSINIALLKALAKIAQDVGFDNTRGSAMDTLTSEFKRYIFRIGCTMKLIMEDAKSSEANMVHLKQTFDILNISMDGLREYVTTSRSDIKPPLPTSLPGSGGPDFIDLTIDDDSETSQALGNSNDGRCQSFSNTNTYLSCPELAGISRLFIRLTQRDNSTSPSYRSDTEPNMIKTTKKTEKKIIKKRKKCNEMEEESDLEIFKETTIKTYPGAKQPQGRDLHNQELALLKNLLELRSIREEHNYGKMPPIDLDLMQQTVAVPKNTGNEDVDEFDNKMDLNEAGTPNNGELESQKAPSSLSHRDSNDVVSLEGESRQLLVRKLLNILMNPSTKITWRKVSKSTTTSFKSKTYNSVDENMNSQNVQSLSASKEISPNSQGNTENHHLIERSETDNNSIQESGIYLDIEVDAKDIATSEEYFNLNSVQELIMEQHMKIGQQAEMISIEQMISDLNDEMAHGKEATEAIGMEEENESTEQVENGIENLCIQNLTEGTSAELDSEEFWQETDAIGSRSVDGLCQASTVHLEEEQSDLEITVGIEEKVNMLSYDTVRQDANTEQTNNKRKNPSTTNSTEVKPKKKRGRKKKKKKVKIPKIHIPKTRVSQELLEQIKGPLLNYRKENGRLVWICPACKCIQKNPMINCDCCRNWFHFDCVGLARAPRVEEQLHHSLERVKQNFVLSVLSACHCLSSEYDMIYLNVAKANQVDYSHH